MAWFWICLCCYLAGSIPFGLLLGYLVRGIDIRKHGSGNIGATNVGRILGHRWFWVVFALDALKGMIPTACLPWLFQDQLSVEIYPHAQVVAALLTIVGHMFPCWLGFSGGKGVATALGSTLVIAPQAGLISLGAFGIVYALWRIVSLGSLAASLTFVFAEFAMLWPSPFSSSNWSRGLISLVVPMLIIIRHRSNIERLLKSQEQGTKNSLSETSTESGTKDQPPVPSSAVNREFKP